MSTWFASNAGALCALQRTSPRCSLALAVALLTGACASRPLEIGREPLLSSVGSGITRAAPEPGKASLESLQPAHPIHAAYTGSLWRDRGADLFRDPRARRIGDILTVTIFMKDKATFDNSSKRSRDSSHGFGVDVGHNVDWRGFASVANAKADSSLKSNSAQDGKGAIARSENIDLRIAAVVTDVLPNGNLVIQGSQELRVNYELRVLTFSGIVNIADIKADNSVSHERIAEARMSYGGRGRIMEVQQPALGHQILDMIFPF
jgi:flagellar L-ring protein FlgH